MIREVVTILTESMEIYKKNAYFLLKISLICTLINFIPQIVQIYADLNNVIWGLITFVVFLTTIYYSSQLYIALIISANDIINGCEITFKMVYMKAKEYVWKFLAYEIATVIILLIVNYLVTAIFHSDVPFIIKVPLILAIISLMLLLASILIMSMISVIFEKNMKSRIKKISGLLKRKILFTTIILFLGHEIFFLPVPIFKWLGGVNNPYLTITENFVSIVNILVIPFSCIIFAKLYNMISVKSDNESESGSQFVTNDF